MNTEAFKTETEEYQGHTITIEWYYDCDCEPPWEHEDGHGSVRDSRSRDKAPGEKELWYDHGTYWFYDYAGAIKLAKKDGWDAPPYKTGTKGQQAQRAVDSDFDYLRRYLTQDWWWCGYVLKVDGQEIDSCWGIDSDSIDEFEKEQFEQAKAQIEKEATEKTWAENHEIATH